ncbi:hypothetical protein MMC24_005660 [Lignoscripta atroalba]|nr:hypothetical protein [Lignoscripta atroalba]
MTAFPMTSEISLHGGVKHSSPLAQNPITADEIGVAVSATRRVSRPMRSILQPSQAEKLGQDAAVDMGPNMQLTPLTAVHFSQPSASTLVGETQSPLSSNFIFSARHGRDDSVPAEPPQLALPDDIKGSIRSIPTQGLNPYVGSHSKSLGERRTTRPPSHPSQKKESSHVMPDTDLSMVPSRIPRGQRSIFGGSFTERPASRGAIEPESVIHRSRGDPVTIPKPPRALSAVGDWGAAIFQQIDQSLEESRPSTARAPIPKPNEQTPPPHSRDLSNASSNYSTTQDSVTEVPTRQPSHRIVVGSPVLHEACSPHPRPTSTVIATDPHFKGSRRDTRTSQHTLSTRAHSILLAELLDTYVQSQNARALAKKKKPETERRKAPTPPQRRDEHKAEPFIIPSEIM